MTENEPTDDPVPGWPPPPEPGGWEGDDPTTPDAATPPAPTPPADPAPPTPPAADPTVPGFGSPAPTYPPGGYAAPGTPPAAPAPGYGQPPTSPPPGGYYAPAAVPPPSGFGGPGGYPPGAGGGYAPSGYGGGYQTQREHPQGTTILVLGICSILCCGLLGPVAWIMGNNALREIDARPGAYSNRGNVQAGRIIGIVASVLLIISVIAWVGILVLGAASSTTTS